VVVLTSEAKETKKFLLLLLYFTYLLNYLLNYLIFTYLLTYFLSCLLTYLLSYTYLLTYLFTYLLTYLLQLSCHSVAIVLTLVQTRQIRINIHKRKHNKNTVQTIQNTVITSKHITKTPTQFSKTPPSHTHAHITKQMKTPTVQDTHQIK
jgi:hypothetical protein